MIILKYFSKLFITSIYKWQGVQNMYLWNIMLYWLKRLKMGQIENKYFWSIKCAIWDVKASNKAQYIMPN